LPLGIHGKTHYFRIKNPIGGVKNKMANKFFGTFRKWKPGQNRFLWPLFFVGRSMDARILENLFAVLKNFGIV